MNHTTYSSTPNLAQQLRASFASHTSPIPFAHDFRPLATLIIEVSLVLLLLGSWLALTLWPNDDYQDAFVMSVVVTSYLYLIHVVRKWWLLPGRRAALSLVLRLYRSTVGAFLVTASVAWLLLALISLPLRQEADIRTDAMIQYGEVRAALK